jgi:hypothetical protein
MMAAAKFTEIRMRCALSFCRVQHLAVGILASATMLYASVPGATTAIDYSGIMRLTVDGWVASQTPEGLFPYGFDFLADRPIEPDRISSSNLIRQAGWTYALALYYRHTRDARLQAPIQRALSAFGRRSLPIGKSQAQRWVERAHVLSLPFARWKLQSALDHLGLLYESSGGGKVVSPDGSYGGALAGTAALVLLTELTYADAAGDNRFAELRSAWLRGLLSLRIPGGGFRLAPTSIDDSDYYNGEGWLAIAVYCDLHRDDAEAAAAMAELDQAMIERYSQRPNSNFYHWGAMAAAQRFTTTRDPRFLVFARKQADLFFNQFHARLKPDENNCADMEGLAATLAVLNQSDEGDTALAERIRRWLADEAAKLPKLQIQPGQVGMALGGEARLRAPRMAEFPGSFLAGLYQPSTRVDAAQHCLSAMIMVERDRLQLPPK